MAHCGWTDCPTAVRVQVGGFVDEVRRTLPEKLVGIYLQGSLALGSFNPQRSDIDMLAVTHEAMSLDEKRQLAEALLAHSNAPSPFEISFLSDEQLHPWHYPPYFDFHYSEDWRAKFVEELQSGTWRTWNDKLYQDEDLGGHVSVVRARGVVLWGRPIAEVFPAVPLEDYLASCLADLAWSQEEGRIENTTYALLNHCRTLGLLMDGQVRSKKEGGEWALQRFPAAHHPAIEQALAAYRAVDEHSALENAPPAVDAERLIAHVNTQLDAQR